MRDNTPAEILRSFLIKDTVVEDHTGSSWPSVYGFFPDDKADFSQDAVCFYDQDGPKEVKQMNGSIVERPHVLIQVRAANYGDGYKKAVAIKRIVDSYVSVFTSVDNTYYLIENAKRTSTIIPMGQDIGTKRRFLFALNYELLISDPTEEVITIEASDGLHTVVHTTLAQ